MIYTAAIIGPGRIGHTLQFDEKREQPASHSAALSDNSQIELIAAVDTNDEALEKIKENYQSISTFNTLEALYNQYTPDLITISVNESSHHQISLETISRKPKLIILEKPVALTLDEASEIEKLSSVNNVPILVNHERRYSEDYILCKKLINENVIGTIQSIYATLSSGMKVYSLNELNTGNYGLIHDGTHLVDILHFLFDTSLTSPSMGQMKLNVNKDVSFLSVFFQNLPFFVNLEFAAQRKYFGFDIEIRGSKGIIQIGNGYLKVRSAFKSPYYTNFRSLKSVEGIERPEKTKYFSNMIDNAVSFLDGKTPILSTLEDGIKALKTLKQIEDLLKN